MIRENENMTKFTIITLHLAGSSNSIPRPEPEPEPEFQ